MNYGRVRQQAALNKFIKERLHEKMDILKTMDGKERARTEGLIIAKAKEDFMSYKNSVNLKKEKENAELANGSDDNKIDEPSGSIEEGSDENVTDEQGSGDGKQESPSSVENEGSSVKDSESSGEEQDGQPVEPELEVKEVNKNKHRKNK